MTLHTQARRAANLARCYPSLSPDTRKRIIAAWGLPAPLVTLARVLAEAERNNIKGN